MGWLTEFLSDTSKVAMFAKAANEVGEVFGLKTNLDAAATGLSAGADIGSAFKQPSIGEKTKVEGQKSPYESLFIGSENKYFDDFTKNYAMDEGLSFANNSWSTQLFDVGVGADKTGWDMQQSIGDVNTWDDRFQFPWN